MNRDEARYIAICYPSSKEPNIITPDEFLSWAKSDLKGGDKRSRGNALSNIKKAIHSRIDDIINSTHVVYANDWNPRMGTNDKLKILKKLDIPYTSIVKVITEIRNTYEHKYFLPKSEIIKAHYETTELWLKNSYDEYIMNSRLGIANLPVLNVTSDTDQNIKDIRITDYVDIVYFWDRKKQLIETTKDRRNETAEIGNLSWKDILEKEKRYIKNINNSKYCYYLSQKNLTKLFKFYDGMGRGGTIYGPIDAFIEFA